MPDLFMLSNSESNDTVLTQNLVGCAIINGHMSEDFALVTP